MRKQCSQRLQGFSPDIRRSDCLVLEAIDANSARHREGPSQMHASCLVRGRVLLVRNFSQCSRVQASTPSPRTSRQCARTPGSCSCQRKFAGGVTLSLWVAHRDDDAGGLLLNAAWHESQIGIAARAQMAYSPHPKALYACGTSGDAAPGWFVVGARAHLDTGEMATKRSRGVLDDLERDILRDEPLDTILRKLVLLGGRVNSAELRTWAGLELRGYDGDSDLPNYRRIHAPIQVDATVAAGIVRQQTISVIDLPAFAREEVTDCFPMMRGVGEIRSAIRASSESRTVKFSLPGAAELANLMNLENRRAHIDAIYWNVSVIALEGVLDQVRTRLAELIAELRSMVPEGESLPTAAQASNAVTLVVNGGRARVNISQATSPVTTSIPDGPNVSPEKMFWTTSKAIFAAIVGGATVIGTVVAVLNYS